MGYTLPEWADEALDLIGINFPNVDEDDYREMGTALREFADELEDHGAEAKQAVSRLLASGEGAAADALEAHWKKVQNTHLADIADVSRTFAGSMDVVADAIWTMKRKAEVELGILAASVGISVVGAIFTGGLSALVGAAGTAACREAIRRAIKEASEAIVEELVSQLTEPVVAKLENKAADLVSELALDALNIPDGGGKGGGPGGMQLNSAGGSGFPSGPGKTGKVHVDHDEHETAATALAGMGSKMDSGALSKLDKADQRHGRAKGKDAFTAPFDALIDGGVKAAKKAGPAIRDHISDGVTRAIRHNSKNHKRNEDSLTDDLKAITSRSDDKGPRGGGGKPEGKTTGNKIWQRAGARIKLAAADLAQLARSAKCRTFGGDPIDMATGEMYMAQADLSLPGVLPLVVGRTHLSSHRTGVFFGSSWISLLDERLERADGGVWWHRSDGSSLIYAREPDLLGDQVWPQEGERIPLTCAMEGGVYTLSVVDHHTGLTRYFRGGVDGVPQEGHAVWWLAEIADRNGNCITVEREADGSPTALLHDGGYHVEVHCQDGLVSRVALRTSEGTATTVTYGYDADGCLVDVVDFTGAAMRFGYDAVGRVTSWTNRNGSTYQYVYDQTGRVVQTVGPDGFLSSTLTYDSGERTTRYTDSTGATTTYRMNTRGQVLAETDPLGNTVLREWDQHDNLLSRTDPMGHTGRFAYDEHDNLVEMRLPDGRIATTTYTSLHLPETVTGADGQSWHLTYDAHGNCTAITGPDGTTTGYTYDASGALVSMTDPAGNTERRTNSSTGLVLSAADPQGNTYTLERDVFGHPVRSTDPSGAVTRLEWSPGGRLLHRTGPDGSTESWGWDNEGNCTSHTDATGATARFAYTHFDLLVSRTCSDGARYDLAYDTELRLTQVTNPQGHSWEYTYDAVGNLVSECDFDGRRSSYARDALGRAASRTTPLGHRITTSFDALGRPLSKDVDGEITSFAYDASGNVIRVSSPMSTVEFERDVLGRVLAETVDGRTTRFTYDELGQLISRTTPTGAHTTFGYDTVGNRSHVVTGQHTLTYGRDEFGRELARSIGPTAGPVTVTSTWDVVGRLTTQKISTASTTLDSSTYGYRADGRVSSVTDEGGSETRYGMDAVGRPLSVAAEGWTESYAYDKAGNQTRAEWPDSALRPESRGDRDYQGTRVRRAGDVRYEYDTAGRVVLRQKKRLSKKPDSWRYVWDAEDRLRSCITPDGTVWTYTYDPMGRRTAKFRMGEDDETPVEAVYFSWDGSTVAEQYDSSTGIALTWDYEGYRPITQLERRLDPDADQPEIDSRFFAIVSDLVGTPTHLVDERGTLAWQSRATVWGATTWSADATAYTPLRFPGQYDDPETGLYYNYFRHYDPETARYASPDPLGLDPSPNPVAYVPCPLTQSDPEGLRPQGCTELGGWYAGLLPANKVHGRQATVPQEVNHIPPKGAWRNVTEPGFYRAGKPHKKQKVRYGPAIRMDRDDHEKLSSSGYNATSIKWHAMQQDLIDNGYLDYAMQMDIDDVRAHHGNKYDDHIKDMIAGLKDNQPLQDLIKQRGWHFDFSLLK